MLTIAHVLDFKPDGTHTLDEFLVALAAALRGRGWTSVYVFSAEPEGGFAASLAEVGAQWLVARGQPTVVEALDLGRRLRRHSPDIVQTMFMSKFHASILTLKLASGARFLITADHTSGSVRAASALGVIAKKMRGRFAGLYTDRFIAVSDFVRRRDTDQLYLPNDKMRVVYNGVNIERYAPVEAPANEELNLAFVGHLIPQKGVLTLLRAVGKLVEGGLPVKLRIAGKGPHETALRDYCRENALEQHVEFLGYVDTVLGVLQAADVVVVPSEWQEACAAVLFEAMACGACLVVSDAGGNSEIVGESGEAGVVFRAGDADDLAAKIRELAKDPPRRAAMRRAARERIVQNFTMQKMVDGYIQVYEELAA